jgi:hypothetical protein
LTCTTTLFQGINLPARNVFVDTPTRGSGVLLDPALLWNFAGRAGRMKEDIVGNVFLVDYDAWVEKPMGEFAKFTIKPALGEILSSHCSLVISALSGNMPKENPKDDIPGQVRASAGLLIAKASQGNVRAFVQRVAPDISAADSFSLIKAADSAAKEINLPAEILIANWVVDPFGQRRLYELLMRKIDSGLLTEIIPLNPHDIDRSGEFYGRIFNDILSSIRGYGGNWGGYVSRIAVPWMKGMPYPAILKTEVRSARRRYEKEMNNEAMNKRLDAEYRMKKIKPVDPSSIIKKTIEIIEDVVRFQFVQLGKVYIDILKLALENSGRADKISSIFDFSLALELGIASVAGRSFIELGLSRIAASVLEGIYPDSNMTVGQAREWLAELDPSLFNISPVIVDELDRLGLLTA